MSYQRGQFSASPVDFNRFLQMTRSSSQSLSPERELKQMMAHGQRARTTTNKAPASDRGRGARPVPETAASAASTSFARHVPTLAEESESRSTSAATAASATAAPPMHGGREGPLSGANPFVSPLDHELELSNSNADVFSAALQWQYGSPLYYPVTNAFYCWNGHTLSPKRRGEYGDLEGVSCDFCGFTHWLESTQDPKAEPSPSKPASRARGKKNQKAAVKEEVSAKPSAPAAVSETIFFHCDTCGVDLCPQCMHEIRDDERYHVPCMKCLQCLAYVSLQKAAAHRCPTATATTAVTASQAPHVLNSLKPEDGVALLKLEPLGPARPVAPIKMEEEADLLGSTLAVPKAAPPTEHAVSTSPARPDEGRRGGRARPAARAASRRKAAKLEPVEAGTAHSARPPALTDQPPALPPLPPPAPAPAAAARRGLWAVQITTRTAAERAEAMRLAADQGLGVAEEAPRRRAVVFHLPTRLAAEKCAGRARDSGLEASVQKNV